MNVVDRKKNILSTSALRSSSIGVVYHWIWLPSLSSSIDVVFHWGCLSLRSSSTEVVFHWGYLPLILFGLELFLSALFQGSVFSRGLDEIRNKANSVQLSWSWDWAWQYSVRPQIWYNVCNPSSQVCTLFLSLAPTFIQILLLMSPVTRSSEPRCIKSIKVFYFGKTLQIKCDCSNSPQSDTIIESIFYRFTQISCCLFSALIRPEKSPSPCVSMWS